MSIRPTLPAVPLPEDLAAFLRERAQKWNDASSIGELYTENAVLHDGRVPSWVTGRTGIASFIVQRFSRAYYVTPVSYGISGTGGHIAGYVTRGEGTAARHFGHVHLSLVRADDGRWRIASETLTFPGPTPQEPLTAERLIADLDAAGIRKAAVLSVAYWFGASPGFAPASANEYARVRGENDWTAEQVAQYPDRLVAFCGVNPLRDYALEEVERCATELRMKGLKLHLGNSGVDVRNAEHAERLQQVMRAANRLGMPITIHLWTGGEYEANGAAHASAFLDRILPEAPDVPVIVAHLAGGGRPTHSALAVFAEAVAARDPRTRNLYFDLTTIAEGPVVERLQQQVVAMMRQIGFDRILWGSDMGPPGPREQWANFRNVMPLTEEEFQIIATNVLPFLR